MSFTAASRICILICALRNLCFPFSAALVLPFYSINYGCIRGSATSMEGMGGWIMKWDFSMLKCCICYTELAKGHILWPVTRMTRHPWPSPRRRQSRSRLLTNHDEFTTILSPLLLCNDVQSRILDMAYSVDMFIVRTVSLVVYSSLYSTYTRRYTATVTSWTRWTVPQVFVTFCEQYIQWTVWPRPRKNIIT